MPESTPPTSTQDSTTIAPLLESDYLYQDEHLVIVNKPADLLTVPGRGIDKQDCLINRVKQQLPNARIIHRLDMATSGIVVIALSQNAQSLMGKIFQDREIEKTYIAVVDGELNPTDGMIDLPLICDWENRPKQKVDMNDGKSAQTKYTRIEYCERSDSSRVELKPITGRSHQLRVHLLAIGHTILGDYFYASEDIKNKSSRLLLHAHQISFIHPITKKPMHITSAVPF